MKNTIIKLTIATVVCVSTFAQAKSKEGANVDQALSIPKPSQHSPESDYNNHPTIVRPNQMITVPISVKNVNYLQCQNGIINSHTFSEEKPLLFKRGDGGKDAFIKTKARKEMNTQKVMYYTDDIDLYVVCDGQVFSMMLQPQMITPQRIILDGGKGNQIASTVKKLNGMPHEETVVDILDKVHSERGNLPAVFSINKANLNTPWKKVTPKTSARLRESIQLEGSGMTVFVYQFYSRLGDSLHEMDVLNAQLQPGTFAVRLYNHRPKPDSTFLGYVVTWEVL